MMVIDSHAGSFTARKPIAGKIWLSMCFLLCAVLSVLMTSGYGLGAEPNEPVIFDFRKIQSYGSLRVIEDTGYFAVGRRYVHAPRVEWVPLKGVDRYELVLFQQDKVLGVTRARSSPAFIKEGWSKVAIGKAGIVITGYDEQGKLVATSRICPFHTACDYDPERSVEKKRPYEEAAWGVFDRMYDFAPGPPARIPPGHAARSIKPIVLAATSRQSRLGRKSFPNLHDWTYVEMCEGLLKLAKTEARKRQVLELAESAGDHLLMCRLLGKDYQYAGLVRGAANVLGGPCRDWIGIKDPVLREKYSRVIEPSKNGYSAEAVLQLYEMTGKKRFLEAALVMAEVFAVTQLDDGSWPARVDGKTGEVLGQYSTSVISVISFMDRLNRIRPDARWVGVRDRAIRWMKRFPLRTYAWVVNFDDGLATATEADPYRGLSNWDLFKFVRYAAAHPEQFDDTETLLKEHLAWNDNHFVFYGPDLLLPIESYYPTCAEQGNPHSYVSRGGCWLPMDFHTSNWGAALLAMYELTGEKIWLEKAKAAANVMTQYQLDDGRTITWIPDRYIGLGAHHAGAGQASFWQSGWACSAWLWSELAAIERPSRVHVE